MYLLWEALYQDFEKLAQSRYSKWLSHNIQPLEPRDRVAGNEMESSPRRHDATKAKARTTREQGNTN